mgnify:CR=1 FL=1
MESHFLKMGIKSPLWLPDEIEMRHLYAILCTMFHRFGLYRVDSLFTFICQMKIHKYTPKNDILLHHDTKKEKSQGGFVMNINTQNLV